ncbi:probable ATP-dependent RNA helicase DHX40 isoform X3 [Monodelphis domestica]|uniref:probable ATP-dependent RNA helicase DHX40 isoform X3 n=1 Tax=Monodelphis domestica TaxID=13616 RepID=UPI0024E228A0|nr:probable ATP-dependent RNA helicase DHX40 isoform X3 [Monodelphis domestica]
MAADREPVRSSQGRSAPISCHRRQRDKIQIPEEKKITYCDLPIKQQRRKLIQAVKDNPFLIVTGRTGSGKTTQLPKYLYEAGFSKHGTIGVTQPRKVAAISVAQRVAEEMNCSLGNLVGYQVRFDDCSSQDTAIKYMTDGCLLRHMMVDPDLTKFSVIILDEAHERTLTTDILFGLLKKLFQEKSPTRKEHLKVVVMSATMELVGLSAFFGNCPVVDIPGKIFPVKEIFCDLIGPKDKENSSYVNAVVKVTLEIHLNELAGDILVFLTEQQRRIFLPPPPGIRKCVVSTNISATSLTIDGIRYVVDGGFVKQLNHNPRLGLDMLEVVPISKSEAMQRTGRAGRTSSGTCFRIYNQDFWNQCMPDYMIPEIKRTSLTSVILTLKCLAIHDVIRFPYLERPDEKLILEALKHLYQCDAINRSGHVTKLGLSMAEFPLSPNLTRAILKAAFWGCEDLLLPIAAMLSVENVFIRPGEAEKQKEAELRHQELSSQAGGFNDFATLAVIFEQCKSSTSPPTWCQRYWIHWRCLQSAFRVEGQLREIIRKLKQQPDFPRENYDGPKHEILRRCLCTGYFTNVARRSVGRTFCTMDGHGTPIHIHPSSALYNQESKLEWIIFHDVLVTSKMYVKTVCPIRYEWVKDLLPKLYQFDAYELSSMARHEVTEEEIKRWENKEDLKQQKDEAMKESLKKMQRRNDDKSILDARARFLERKHQRSQGITGTLKETD